MGKQGKVRESTHLVQAVVVCLKLLLIDVAHRPTHWGGQTSLHPAAAHPSATHASAAHPPDAHAAAGAATMPAVTVHRSTTTVAMRVDMRPAVVRRIAVRIAVCAVACAVEAVVVCAQVLHAVRTTTVWTRRGIIESVA